MTKILVNPFFVYILSFVIVLFFYSLGWSELFPPITSSVIFFFAATFIIASLFGMLVQHHKRIYYQPTPQNSNRSKFLLTGIVWVGYGMEFIYNKGIPLLMVFQGDLDYDYRLFGIPAFHVLLVTFNSFLAVYFFHQVISRFSITGFIIFTATILPSLLIINRGMLLMMLTACLFIYVSSLKKIRWIQMINLVVLLLIVFYFFGLLGNLRQTGTWSSRYIIESSKATPQFKDSIIPKKYFWTYLYVSSPLANFQTTVNRVDSDRNSWAAFLNFEILPDFISKRTAELAGLTKDSKPQVTDWLNASTFYTGSYVALGWLGVILMFGFFLMTTVAYLFLLRRESNFYGTGLAILNTFVLYCTFDNMYAFSGLCLQLVYPLLFSYLRPSSRIQSAA